MTSIDVYGLKFTPVISTSVAIPVAILIRYFLKFTFHEKKTISTINAFEWLIKFLKFTDTFCLNAFLHFLYNLSMAMEYGQYYY